MSVIKKSTAFLLILFYCGLLNAQTNPLVFIQQSTRYEPGIFSLEKFQVKMSTGKNLLKVIPTTTFLNKMGLGMTFGKKSTSCFTGIELGAGTRKVILLQTTFPGPSEGTYYEYEENSKENQISIIQRFFSIGAFLSLNREWKNWLFSCEPSLSFYRLSDLSNYSPLHTTFYLTKINAVNENEVIGMTDYKYRYGSKNPNHQYSASLSVKIGKFIDLSKRFLIQIGPGISGFVFKPPDKIMIQNYVPNQIQPRANIQFNNRNYRIWVNLNFIMYLCKPKRD